MSGTELGLRKLNSAFETKYISEAGTQNINKDYFGYIPMDGYICWAVAETYDNDNEAVSAKIAVNTVLEMFSKRPGISSRKIKSYIKAANRQLREQSGQFQLKASIMVAVSNYKKLRYVQCGNCRLYIFRNNGVFLKSEDQSLLNSMIQEGSIPDDGSQGMEESRNLFNYLGKQGKIKISSSKKTDLSDGDVLVLSTWGFWEKIGVLEMLDALDGAETSESYLEELQDLLLSKQETGDARINGRRQSAPQINNYTAASVFVKKTFVSEDKTRKYIKLALMIGIPLLIIGIITGILLYAANIRRNGVIETIAQYSEKGDMHLADKNYERAFIEYDSGVTESKSLKEKKGKKGIQNNGIKDSLAVRQRTSQLLIDGDAFFKSGEFALAKSSYENALIESRNDIDLRELLSAESIEKEIENKITLCEAYAQINDLILVGDIQADLGQYAYALESYNEAKNMATEAGYNDALRDMRLKISEVTSKQTEEDQRLLLEKIKSIDAGVLAGDTMKSAGDFDRAALMYERAERDYVEAGEITKASEVRYKIIDLRAEQLGVVLDNRIREIEAAVLEADTAASMGDFEKALNMYEKAEKDYKDSGDMSKASDVRYKIIDIQNEWDKAELTKIIEAADAAVLEGDAFASFMDYEKAFGIYEKAEKDYIEAGEISLASEVRYKIISLEAEQKKLSQENAISDIESAVFEGDKAALAGEYERAVKIYEKAAWDYIEAGETSKASELQYKIIDLMAEEKTGASDKAVKAIDEAALNAEMAEADGDLDKAIQMYEDAAKKYIAAGEIAKASDLQAKIVGIKSAKKEQSVADIDNAILEADMAASKGDFEKALGIYEKAVKDYTDAGETAKSYEIQYKITELKSKAKGTQDSKEATIADDFIKLGDMYLERGIIDSAIENYNKAKEVYRSLNMTDEIKNVNEKISEANSKKAELELASKILQAQFIADEGDEFFKKGEYPKAIESYRKAQALFQNLGQVDRVLYLQEMIRVCISLEDSSEASKSKDQITYGQMIVLLGDKAFDAADYQLARDYYVQAKEIFQQAGAYDLALDMHIKILETEKNLP